MVDFNNIAITFGLFGLILIIVYLYRRLKFYMPDETDKQLELLSGVSFFIACIGCIIAIDILAAILYGYNAYVWIKRYNSED